MDPFSLAQECRDGDSGFVDTAAMLYGYKFFDSWKDIDYTEVLAWERKEAEKNASQSKNVSTVLPKIEKMAHSPRKVAPVEAKKKIEKLLSKQNEPVKENLVLLLDYVKMLYNAGLLKFELVQEEMKDDGSVDKEYFGILETCCKMMVDCAQLCSRATKAFYSLRQEQEEGPPLETQEQVTVRLYEARCYSICSRCLGISGNLEEAYENAVKSSTMFSQLDDKLREHQEMRTAALYMLRVYCTKGDERFLQRCLSSLVSSHTVTEHVTEPDLMDEHAVTSKLLENTKKVYVNKMTVKMDHNEVFGFLFQNVSKTENASGSDSDFDF